MILPPVLGEFDEELVEMSNYNSISKKKKKKREKSLRKDYFQ